jgi:hypothetical protein
MFTATPLFAIAMNVVLHFMLQFYFRESYVGILEKKSGGGKRMKVKKVREETNNILKWHFGRMCPARRPCNCNKSCRPMTGWLWPSVAECASPNIWCSPIWKRKRITNIWQLYTVFLPKRIGISFAMMMFMWTSTEVVTYESFAHTARGILTLIVYISYIVFNLGKRLDFWSLAGFFKCPLPNYLRVNERMVCLSALFFLLIFHLVTFSWPFLPNDVAKYGWL